MKEISNFILFSEYIISQPSVFVSTEIECEIFEGEAPHFCDLDFIYIINLVENEAKRLGLKLQITHSLRGLGGYSSGVIDNKEKPSNHLIGHAIDFNVVFEGVIYTSLDMKISNLENLPREVVVFLYFLRKSEKIRMRGHLKERGSVHIDDNLYYRDRKTYMKKLFSRRVQCYHKSLNIS